MNLYGLAACEKLIEQYTQDFGGEVTEIEEGCLGLGTLILHGAPGKKTIVIQEVFLNAWSSGHTMRLYNSMPKKYEKILETIL